jgi:hypothetical protein
VLSNCVEHDAGAVAKGETADTGAEGRSSTAGGRGR